MKTQMNASTNALMNAMTAMAMFTIAAVFPDVAMAGGSAQQGAAAVAQDVATNVNQGILPIISIGSYVGGTVFGISTLLDAKKYSENPGSNGPLGKVLTKGAVAAGLFSLPTVMNNIQDSLFNQGGQAEFSDTKFNSTTVGP
jgi:hypothetical protein